MEEKIAQSKFCKQCGTSFTITDRDLAFYDKVSPTFGGKKFPIPTPTLCPDCRQQRRLSFRNERKIYTRKCDNCGKSIISMYSPDTGYKIYCSSCRWDDKMEGLVYGPDIDSDVPFFQQFQTIISRVPKIYLDNMESENSEYGNISINNKNCYLVFATQYCENCYYTRKLLHSRNCVDCENCDNCELCFECNYGSNCHGCFYVSFSKDCSNSHYLYNCTNCHNCFGCVNLFNQSYCIFNTPYSSTEYHKKISQLIGQYGIDKFLEFKMIFPHKENSNQSTEQCIGDYLINCKDCSHCYDLANSEGSKYCTDAMNNSNHNMDCLSATDHSEFNYECVTLIKTKRSIGCNRIRDNSYNLYYCDSIYGCHDCFGCAGLKQKHHCILNKQYDPKDYEKLVPQIIEKMQSDGERGEFFPSSLSPFGYNETIAQEYFPLTKDEALTKGFKRSDYEAPFPKTDAKDVIICEVTGKPFRLVKPELEFYQKHHLPLPTKHPDVRHAERMALRNPRKLRNRKCMKCGVDIQTTYAPERKEIVYCEKCYNKEIYG